MNFLFALLAIIASAVFPSIGISQEGVEGAIIRPNVVDAKVEGCTVSAPGNYDMIVGNFIELEYSYPVVPAAMPKKVSHKETLRGVVRLSPLGFRHAVTPKLVGRQTIVFCFDAAEKGSDTITLIVDEAEYAYTFKVVNDPEAVPELCEAAYFAQQVPGAVILIATGTHPTPGFKTYFEQLPITIFPPQHRLMHIKPTGIVAQVLTPFVVYTSFPADDKVEEVVIHDASGEHKIKVEQVPEKK